MTAAKRDQASAPCELCRDTGGEPLWHDAQCRVVWAGQPEYAGFCRVIAHAHVKEMTDLATHDAARMMQVVFAVEAALRDLLQPDKINLASFGNVVPHLHWHVIPRFADDAHFPNPVWGEQLRPGSAHAVPPDFVQRMRAELAQRLA
ncbi:MAG: HIT family protein [Burkholderiales bacterium]|nr:HIT family protein [Burkholderiales bacterium]